MINKGNLNGICYDIYKKNRDNCNSMFWNIYYVSWGQLEMDF